MTVSTSAHPPVERDAQGFLLHAEGWNEEIAAELARESGIRDLTDRQWQVITSMRRAFVERGSRPWLRMVASVSGVSIQELYRLFPRAPSKLVAKIAGIPKLRSCI